MEIILLERIEHLGQMGDVVRVKDGYARNYLLPQQKALRATKGNRERFERERSQLETRNLQRRGEAEDMAKRMEGASCVLVRQASDTGQLYGSVTARDIAEALAAAGTSVERRQIVLDRPIKTLGLHQVRLSLHPEVSVFVEVNVARSEQEAAQQAAGETGEFFEREELAPEEEGEAAEAAPGAEEEEER